LEQKLRRLLALDSVEAEKLATKALTAEFDLTKMLMGAGFWVATALETTC
jgi:hypothetical protein